MWNLTESEHSDGVTRFVILKGGAAYRAEGRIGTSTAGRSPVRFSAKLLLAGLGLDRSPSDRVPLAWDLDRRMERRDVNADPVRWPV